MAFCQKRTVKSSLTRNFFLGFLVTWVQKKEAVYRTLTHYYPINLIVYLLENKLFAFLHVQQTQSNINILEE